MKEETTPDVRPRGLGLALGSGAIRGLAHIGVLKALDNAGIRPDLIVGASAGALIGALYCVGVDMEVLECFAASLSWRQLADPSFKGTGMIRGDKIHALIRLMTKNLRFEDCNPAFAAIATDLCTGERVVIQEGNLADALRASISIPGVFKPFEMNGRYLADGGIVGRVPIAATRELGASTVVAVDVVGGPRVIERPTSIFEVIVQSVEILESEVARASLGHADVVVVPEIAGIGPLELGKARELVAAGKRAMEGSLPEVTALMGGDGR